MDNDTFQIKPLRLRQLRDKNIPPSGAVFEEHWEPEEPVQTSASLFCTRLQEFLTPYVFTHDFREGVFRPVVRVVGRTKPEGVQDAGRKRWAGRRVRVGTPTLEDRPRGRFTWTLFLETPIIQVSGEDAVLVLNGREGPGTLRRRDQDATLMRNVERVLFIKARAMRPSTSHRPEIKIEVVCRHILALTAYERIVQWIRDGYPELDSTSAIDARQPASLETLSENATAKKSWRDILNELNKLAIARAGRMPNHPDGYWDARDFDKPEQRMIAQCWIDAGGNGIRWTTFENALQNILKAKVEQRRVNAWAQPLRPSPSP